MPLKMINKRYGLSYIEIIIVIGLLSILIATALRAYMTAGDHARYVKVMEDLDGLARAMSYYLMDKPDPVTAWRQLQAAGTDGALEILIAAGRISSGERMLDPWGREYALATVSRDDGTVEFYTGCVSPQIFDQSFDRGFPGILEAEIPVEPDDPPDDPPEGEGEISFVVQPVQGYWIKVDEAKPF